MKAGESELEVRKLPWWVGDRDLEPDTSRRFIDELGRSTGRERPQMDARTYIELACSVLGVEEERLASKRQDSETARLRRLMTACGVERWEQRSGALAGVLRKHPVVVSRWVAEARELRRQDEEIQAQLDTLDNQLSKRAVQLLTKGRIRARETS